MITSSVPSVVENNNSGSERLADTVYIQLREDILFGQYDPLAKLKLDGLRNRYEASANTIREALVRLVSEGFVDAEGQRGFSVAAVSRADLQDIIETRILLESQAVRLSLAEADLHWEGEVMAAHYRLAKAEEMADEDHDRHRNLLEQYDCDFHRTIISGCHSQWVLRFHALSYDHALRYRSEAVKRVEGPQLEEMLARAKNDHVALRDAALKKDADQLIKLLQVHIRKAAEFALAYAGNFDVS